MDDGSRPGVCPRVDASHTYDMTTAVYGMFPSRAPDNSVRRSRAGSPTKIANKRKNIDTASPLSIRLMRSTASPAWIPQTKRSRLQIHQMELHQSTCLNLNMANDDSTTGSDLWILPDFDDWELDNESSQQATTKSEDEWAPLLRRAASSNRERLRARLEGDGWDFVGGRYGEDEKVSQEAVSQHEESVDEEFDVVVLPMVQPLEQVSC